MTARRGLTGFLRVAGLTVWAVVIAVFVAA